MMIMVEFSIMMTEAYTHTHSGILYNSNTQYILKVWRYFNSYKVQNDKIILSFSSRSTLNG